MVIRFGGRNHTLVAERFSRKNDHNQQLIIITSANDRNCSRLPWSFCLFKSISISPILPPFGIIPRAKWKRRTMSDPQAATSPASAASATKRHAADNSNDARKRHMQQTQQQVQPLGPSPADDFRDDIVKAIIAAQASMSEPSPASPATAAAPAEPKDPRESARKVFHQYIKSVDDSFKSATHDQLHDGNVRIPIAANSGASGSGKTVQLRLMRNYFCDMTGGAALAFTFNEQNVQQDKDKNHSVETRIAHRLILAAAGIDVAQLGLVWGNIRARSEYRMAPLTEAPVPGTPEFDAEEKLTTPSRVLAICRLLINGGRDKPLLITADELIKTGPTPSVGEESQTAVTALKFLCDLTQASCTEAKKHATGGLVYVVASAFAAYNVHEGITVNSNRSVFWLPLPPMYLQQWEKYGIPDGLNPANRGKARHLLWLNQGNARQLAHVAAQLRTQTNDTMQKFYNENKLDAGAIVDDYIGACHRKGVDPAKVLQNVFWALKWKQGLSAFHSDMNAALCAEAAGLCTILRGPVHDTVYMHPVAVQQLCSALQDQLNEAAFIPAVENLARKLQEFSAEPGHPDSGKLYEEIITLATVCRIETCFNPAVELGVLLGKKSDMNTGIFNQRVACQSTVMEKAIECFPRAAEKLNGSWRNEPCTKMPNKSEAPWYSIPTDRYNVVSTV